MLEIKRSVARLLALAVAAPVLACSDSSGPPAIHGHLAFTVQPASTNAVSTLATVEVSVLDARGSVATGATNVISLRLKPIEGIEMSGLLQGTLSRQAVNGVATFTDLQMHVARPGYVLEAASNDQAGAASTAFDISAGPATAILPADYMEDPFEGPAGSTLVIVVWVADAYDNPVAATPVSFAVTAGGGKVDPVSVETDAYGFASCTLTLGPEAGPNVVEATSPVLPGQNLVLTATGLSASP